ncbi:MAG: alpha/beta fold hydrolase [Actinomycetes bacterium]
MATALEDLRLHVRYDEGSGPVIVLLHGINSNAESWRTVVDTIGPEYRVIAADLLGFGESPKPDDIDYTADQHAAVLAATLDDLGVTERFVLVGYSMGGNVAIRYAATHPDRLRRLFLLAAPFYLPPEVYSRASFGWHYAQARFFQWMWRLVGRQKERDTLAYGLASGPLAETMRDFLKTGDVAAHWDVMQKNLANTVSAATFAEDLPKLTMPTVFALGIRDPIVRPDQTMALRRLKPTLEVRRMVGLSADHMLLIKAPAEVAEEILADEVRTLHVRHHRGTGAPVVLLPGLGEDGRRWLPVADRLAARREVAVLDLLGFGESPRPLSSHYTLEDHAAGVLSTVAALFGDVPVTLVGRGLGASVALECAAASPHHVSDVVAFAPALVDPTTAGNGQRSDPAVAGLIAVRETWAELVRDERAQRLSGERLEAEVVPTLRSVDTVLATDAGALLARQARPVRVVLPTRDPVTPRDWLAAEAARRPALDAVAVDGDAAYPYEHPDAAAALIEGKQVPDADAAPPDARVARPELAPARGPEASVRGPGYLARRLLGGANAQLIRHGLLAVLAGLLLLLLPVPVPPRLLAWGFALWLLVSSIQTIAGAVGLKRNGNAALGWLLIGLVSLLFAGFLALNDAFALGLVRWAVAGWALVRAATTLFAAWRAPTLPGRRLWLVLEGLLAAVVGVAILAVPDLGGRLLRWVLGGYLTASGAASLALARRAHVRTKQRIEEYVTTPAPVDQAAS